MTSAQTFRKTRLAPTPSGFLHLGNALSFALTALLAEKSKARILLRIDDLDRERIHAPYVQDIFDTLRFLQISWHKGPKDFNDYKNNHSQLQRLDHYQHTMRRLQELKAVYACTCSRTDVQRNNINGGYSGTCRYKQLPLDTPNACWRLNTSTPKTLPVKTLSGKTLETQLPDGMRDFVVRKKDGFAAYQLASLVDDAHFGIDLVVRGQDLWPSTLAQLYLALVLGLESFLNCTFYHHPLLVTATGEKLSKSAGDTSIHYLRQHQVMATEVYALLGRELGLTTPVQRWQDLETWLSAQLNSLEA